jgi:thioredoxin reductase (NADPH)
VITADLISRIALFARLPEEERASLAARAADITLRQGEWLVVEGQEPSFYGLIEGHVDVLKEVAGREERIFTYGPGDSFGELPLLLGAPSSQTSVPPSRAACFGSRGRTSCSWSVTVRS